MERAWSFLQNPILSVTQERNPLGIKISNWHDSALSNDSGDPFILSLYTPYHLINKTYLTAFASQKSKVQYQISCTNIFTGMINDLAMARINAWDSAIQVVYPIGSSRYLEMLPHGHAPFQAGTQEERKAAVEALAISIGADAALAALLTLVTDFYTVLEKADTLQKGAFTDVNTASENLETARVAMAEGQYGNLGALMQHFKNAPDKAAKYFDLKSIRSGKQMYFTAHVKKLSIHKIVERTLAPDAQILLTNIGVTDLKFYASDRKNGTIGMTFILVTPGNSITISASDLGDMTLNHFIMVYNPDTINKGEFELEFL